VNTVKSATWADVLGLLGKEGNKIMLDLFLNCGVFVIVKNGRGNLYQLSGTPCLRNQNWDSHVLIRSRYSIDRPSYSVHNESFQFVLTKAGFSPAEIRTWGEEPAENPQ